MVRTSVRAVKPGVVMLLHKSVEHDSRVRREAVALTEAGYGVTVLELARPTTVIAGFGRRSVLPPAWVRRLLPFHLYRAVFLIAFVVGIVRSRPQLVHAHDAAMLLPGLIGARLTGARLLYDSHELASGVPYRQGTWARLAVALERLVVPRCAAVITVSDGIAERLRADYGLGRRPAVVRNVCDLPRPAPDDPPAGLRARLGIGSAPLVLHQGAPVPGRGAEILVRAIREVPGAHLAFLGTGVPSFDLHLAELARREDVAARVHRLPSVPLAALLSHTQEADVGVSLLEATCENHRLALPNKLFEYLAAGVPVVTSDLPEIRKLVLEHGVGWTADPSDPDAVASALRYALAARGDEGLLERVRRADDALRWERERDRLLEAYASLGEPPRTAATSSS